MARFSPTVLLLAALAALAARSPAEDAAVAAADPNDTLGVLTMRREDIRAERTSAEARAAFLRTTRDEKIGATLRGEIDEETWGGAFWDAGIINERTDLEREGLRRAFADLPNRSDDFRTVVLRSAYTLFPGDFAEEVAAALPLVESPKGFAIGCYDLLLAEKAGALGGAELDGEALSPANLRPALRRRMEAKFPDWADTAQLEALAYRLDHAPAATVADRPPLVDLLAAPFVAGRPVLFSLQRVDRRQPGLAIVRGADGRFVRQPDGSLFSVTQLAMSRTNMPGTISLGNTPQGLLTIRGAGYATNKYIGPTPYLYSKVPFEASVEEYFHGERSGEWSRNAYAELLPVSWRGYEPLYEAWLAGKAGRSEMLTHGTTINPDYYIGESYYPMTPSAGCLCSMEFWAPGDGSLLYSDQLAILKAFVGHGGENGYVAVVELDAAERRVTPDEIVRDVLAAEARLVRETGGQPAPPDSGSN